MKISNNLRAGYSGVIERLPSRKGWPTIIRVSTLPVKEVDAYGAKL